MSTSIAPARPLAGLKQALRQCRAERQRWRAYATTPDVPKASSSIPAYPPLQEKSKYPSLEPRIPPPKAGFRPSQAIKQNRFEEGLKKIKVIPGPRSSVKSCPDPVKLVFQDQLKILDPTGARTRLFDKGNPERAQPGDILLVRLKSGDPFSGVCLSIRQRNSPIDTSILLRNQLTRVGVEMWYKVYSPNVEGIEIVQRREKRARRARLYYMRQPRHDVGSVEGIVRAYMRQRMGGVGSSRAKGRDANSNKKKNNKRGRN